MRLGQAVFGTAQDLQLPEEHRLPELCGLGGVIFLSIKLYSVELTYSADGLSCDVTLLHCHHLSRSPMIP